jgi:hypothetical protein
MITQADLVARADGGQFVLTQAVNTSMTTGPQFPGGTHPLQRLVPHGSANRTAITWSAVYRQWQLRGNTLVVDTAVAASFLQLVLNEASSQMDCVDLRLNLVNVPPNATRASSPTVGMPQFIPGLTPSGGT